MKSDLSLPLPPLTTSSSSSCPFTIYSSSPLAAFYSSFPFFPFVPLSTYSSSSPSATSYSSFLFFLLFFFNSYLLFLLSFPPPLPTQLPLIYSSSLFFLLFPISYHLCLLYLPLLSFLPCLSFPASSLNLVLLSFHHLLLLLSFVSHRPPNKYSAYNVSRFANPVWRRDRLRGEVARLGQGARHG